MNQAQEDFIGKLHLALARCVHDGHNEWAEALSKILEYLDKNEYVIAVLESENIGFDDEIVEALRTTFNVKKWV